MSETPTPGDSGTMTLGLRDQPWLLQVVYWLGALIAVLHLVMNFTTLFSTQWQSTLHFVGLGILAIWRSGRAYRTLLRDFELQFGDALLLFGPVDRLRALAGHPDLIVLSGSLQEPRRSEKAKLASLVMAFTLAPVLFGLEYWARENRASYSLIDLASGDIVDLGTVLSVV